MIDPASSDAVRDALLTHLNTLWPNTRYAVEPTRIFGGNQSFVYGLVLEGAPNLCGPLVLRILRPFLPVESVVREAVLQNALYDAGYPVARVGHQCTDPTILGGAFQLMERLPGKPQLAAGADTQGTIGLREALTGFGSFVFGSWPERTAEMHHRLHALQLGPLLETCEKHGLSRDALSFDVALDRLAVRAELKSLHGLRPAFAWLRETRAFTADRAVLCHGDFFPNQLMYHRARVTGVIDWSDACIAPPELDVAMVTVGVATLPVPFGTLGRTIVKRRARHFFDVYAAQATLDPDALAYAEVFRCTHSLLAVAERRRALVDDPTAPPNPNPYDHPSAVAELTARVQSITGGPVSIES